MSNLKRRKKISVLAPTDALLEGISDGVFTVDLEWRVTSFNRAAEEITGVSREEADRPPLLRGFSLKHVRRSAIYLMERSIRQCCPQN